MPGKLGEFEELVMLAVARLHPEAYGVNIRRELHEKAQRKVTLSTVHESLNRLLGKGYLQSEFGEATQKRGGKRKKFFRLTTVGFAILAETKKLREEMWKGIPQISLSGK